MAVGSPSLEEPMEARIARLESDVAHIGSDVAEIKLDVRALRDRMDTRIDRVESKLDSFATTFATKTDFDSCAKQVDKKFASLDAKLDKGFFWLLSLQLGSVVGMLGVLARGFDWI